jgi:hypothetical protein
MSRGEKLDRRLDRPAVADPWFGKVIVPSYASAESVDQSGYSISDLDATSTLPERYGEEINPVAGGYLAGEAGAASTESGLGLDSFAGEFLGPNHAQRPEPIEYTGGCSPEHALGSRAGEFGGLSRGDDAGNARAFDTGLGSEAASASAGKKVGLMSDQPPRDVNADPFEERRPGA